MATEKDAAAQELKALRARVKELETALDDATQVRVVVWLHNGELGVMCVADLSEDGTECLDRCRHDLKKAHQALPVSSTYAVCKRVKVNTIAAPKHVPASG